MMLQLMILLGFSLSPGAGVAPADEMKTLRRLNELGATIACDETLPNRSVVTANLMASRRGSSDDDVTLLRHLPELQELVIGGTKLSADGLKCLVHLKKLHTVRLERMTLSAEHFKALAALELKRISLIDCKVDPVCWPMLAQFKSVHALRLHRTPLKDGDLQHIARHARITELAPSRPLTRSSVKTLLEMKQLERLDLYDGIGDLLDSDLQTLARLPNLKHLGVGSQKITREGLKHLADFPKLESLGLGLMNQLKSSDLEAIPNLRLKSLILPCGTQDDAGLKHLLRLTEPTDLDLQHWHRFSEDWYKVLIGHKKLQTIRCLPFDLADEKKANEILDVLCQLPDLRALDLMNDTKVLSGRMDDLLKLQKLEHLGLYGTKLSNNAADKLIRFPRLNSLSLSKVEIGDLHFLPKMKSLEHLGFSDGPLTNRQIASIAECRSLRSLALGNAECSDKGLLALTGLTDLESLDLRGTNVTDDGIKHLARLKKLKRIELPSGVSDEALKTLRQLEDLESIELVFPGKGITESGLQSLKALPRLREIRVYSTKEGTFQSLTDLMQLSFPHCKHFVAVITGADEQLPKLQKGIR